LAKFQYSHFLMYQTMKQCGIADVIVEKNGLYQAIIYAQAILLAVGAIEMKTQGKDLQSTANHILVYIRRGVE